MKHLPSSALLLWFAACGVHAAPVTGVTGNDSAFSNYQPTLAITEVITTMGIFPSRGPGSGDADGGMLGFVYGFAGNFAPSGSALAQGQLNPISQNTALFSLLGTNYGGNGTSTFGLPDLAGRAIIGDSSNNPVGAVTGSPTAMLTAATMPAHAHTIPGDTTGTTGGSQAFDNMQPVLSMRRLIATQGIFPSQGGGGSAAFLGQVATFAGNFTPVGWTEADGRLLSIAQNSALFSIIGTTYGGDGQTTFALPDLRDRVSVGAGNGLSLGATLGAAATTLSTAQLPTHTHTLPGGGNTDPTGGSASVSNMEPSLALNYIISLQGIFPSFSGGGSSFDATTPLLGQISEFAGNFAPGGWALANGQLLSIAQNQALFALLGTTYGGDGRTTFALPDFRGRTAVGWGTDDFGNSLSIGEQFGAASLTLTASNLPAHLHSLPNPVPPTNGAPEPRTLLLMAFGLPLLARRRR